ncbi:dTMP kinase [Actinosynnema sp. CA-299493]
MCDSLFVALEGIDASGKTTLAAALAGELRAEGMAVELHKEPGMDRIGGFFRAVSRAADTTATALALLSSADRHDQQSRLQHLRRSGTVVLADRYYLSGLAYHTADGIDPAFYQLLNHQVVKPDAYLYLDLDPRLAAGRRTRGPDGYWEQPGFTNRLTDAYETCLALVAATESATVVRVDASQLPDAVLADARRALTGLCAIR